MPLPRTALYNEALEPQARLVLRAAADLIDTHGWIRRAYHREGQGYCTLGAIIDTSKQMHPNPVTHIDASYVAQVLLQEYLADHEQGRPMIPDEEVVEGLPATYTHQSIVGWNDYYAPDAQRVVEVLRAVGAEA